MFTIIGITTGFYTWWLNYLAKPMRALKIKIPLTFVMLITEIILLIWRINVPDVLEPVHGSNDNVYRLVWSIHHFSGGKIEVVGFTNFYLFSIN